MNKIVNKYLYFKLTANRLVGGLASENVRWAEAVAEYMQQGTTLPGDILLVTAFISCELN